MAEGVGVCAQFERFSGRIFLKLIALLVVSFAFTTRPAEPRDTRPPELKVAFRDGRLTVEVKDTPWAELLKELSRKSRIVFHVLPPLEGSVSASFKDLPVEQATKDRRTTPPRIRLSDGLVSVEVQGRPWPAFLREWRRATGIVLHLLPAPAGALTVSFRDLPLAQAVRRLFGPDANFVFLYETAGPTALPSEVWVLGPGQRLPPALTARLRTPPQTPRTQPDDEDEPDSIPAFLRALRDPDPRVRMEGAAALGDSGDDSAVGTLAQVLGGDQSPEVRSAAAEALGKLGSPDVLSALGRALRDGAPAVRGTAVEAIAEIGGEQAVAVLRRALREGDAEVKSAAAAALEELEDRE